jgi:hypothetical protein
MAKERMGQPLPRRIELDALRGVMLIIMALTHLPTRLRAYSDQPLGFVSAAEGFVFLSAFVASCDRRGVSAERGLGHARSRLWARARRVYGYHLALLAFAFSVIACIAAITSRPGLRNLLTFYFESPGMALLGGPLLLYQPPLLDILPMYVIFLAASPLLLARARCSVPRRWSSLGSYTAQLRRGGRRVDYDVRGHVARRVAQAATRPPPPQFAP